MNVQQLAQRRGFAGVPTWRLVDRMPEAAGALAGHPQDASAGLEAAQVGTQTWAFNTSMGEWQRVYTVTTLPQGLSGVAQQVYGDPTKWTDIYNVPQNKAIQGPNPNAGLITGDKILIPHLQRPPSLPLSPTPATTTTVETTEVENVPEQTIEGEALPRKAGWWTPTKVVIIGGLVAGGSGLVWWAVRKNRRRRRRAHA
jgi:hypothetical protein